MNFSELATEIAKVFGLQPSTFLLYLFILTQAANAGARLIPNNATGALGVLRKICTIVGLYVSSRVAPGVTINDVAKAALETPPIPQKVERDAAADEATK